MRSRIGSSKHHGFAFFYDVLGSTDRRGRIERHDLTRDEQEVSYRRRLLHGKIDILRAELVNRLRRKHDGGDVLITGEDVQRLTDILANRQADPAAGAGDGGA